MLLLQLLLMARISHLAFQKLVLRHLKANNEHHICVPTSAFHCDKNLR